MKKAVFWMQMLSLAVEAFAVILLGLEVHGRMDPDHITAEAVIIGICLAINMICAFCKLYMEKRDG